MQPGVAKTLCGADKIATTSFHTKILRFKIRKSDFLGELYFLGLHPHR